jgi:hypothetical protein
VRGLHYPENASLTATQGNTACSYACNEGFILTVVGSTPYCKPFNAQLPALTLSAYTATSSLSLSDIAKYNKAFAAALETPESLVFTSFQQNTLTVLAQSETQENVLSLAAKVSSDAVQRSLNSFSDARLAVPIVEKASLAFSFQTASAPAPAPAPVPAPPPPISLQPQLRSRAAITKHALALPLLPAIAALYSCTQLILGDTL